MKVKIGLEVHCPLFVQRKLFCNCLKNLEDCSICRGEPGTYPLPPKEEVLVNYRKIINLLELKIVSPLKFQRKHYQYPDLPKGFQITTSRNGLFKEQKINSVYFAALEEDPASLKGESPIKICYKRCGNPLVEIITRPVFKEEEEVKEFYTSLEKDLELNRLKSKKEPLRVDLNISLDLEESDKVSNPRVEIKNIHSLTNILVSISSERKRLEQAYLLEKTKGKRIITLENQDHTRSFCTSSNSTLYSRPKSSYIFLLEQNLEEIDLEKVELTSVPSRYLEVRTSLYSLIEGISNQEIQQLISKDWANYLIDNISEEKDTEINKIKLRSFISILKYAEMNNYSNLEIEEVSKLILNDPVTKETIKQIIITRSYLLFYAKVRPLITLDELIPIIRKIPTASEKIMHICMIEKERKLPTTEIKNLIFF